MEKLVMDAKHNPSLLSRTPSVWYLHTDGCSHIDRSAGGIPPVFRIVPWKVIVPAVLLMSISVFSFPDIVIASEGVHIVHGKVIDGSTGDGLPFASILVESTGYRTSADADGEFIVPLPEKGSRLTVTFVGYKGSSIAAEPEASRLVVTMTPAAVAMQDVSVTATRATNQMENSLALESADIKEFAGITRDPLRALQLMPGVSTNDEASAKMDVRGGTWDENTVLIDGVEIYDPYHLKEIALASIGIFNSDLIKTLDFSAGGFGAKYGDALSSVTNIYYSEGNRNRFEGTINANPLDASATIQGPINKSTSFIVGARGSYLGYLVKEVNIISNAYAGYYDVQGDMIWHVTGTSKVQADFLYSKDDASQSPADLYSSYAQSGTFRATKTLITQSTDEQQSFDGHYSNDLFSLHYDDVIADNLNACTLLSLTGDYGHAAPTQTDNINMTYNAFPDLWSTWHEVRSQSYDLAMTSLSLNQEINYVVSASWGVDAGAQLKRMDYRYNPDMYSIDRLQTNVAHFPDTTVSVESSTLNLFDTTAVNAIGYAFDGFIQQHLQITNNLELTLGARYDYFNLDKEGRYSPRVNISYVMPLGIEANAAWGVYYQLPTYNQLRISGASVNNTQMQMATHYLIGLKKEISSRFTFQVQYYEKYYSDLIPALTLPWGGLFYDSYDRGGVGFAKGGDVYYRMDLGKFDLSFSYSYLLAEEKQSANASFYPRVSDQRHTVSVAVTWRLGNTWEIYLRGFYGSGYAYTPYTVVTDSATMISKWVEGMQNSGHYPAYERLDVRIAKSFVLFDNPAQFYVDVTNVLNRKNIWTYNYTYDSKGRPAVQPMRLLGIIPTIGISWNF